MWPFPEARESYVGFEHLCDALLQMDDGFLLPAHKTVLAMHSVYFRELFCNNINSSVIRILHIRSSIMRKVLQYVNTGKAEINEKNITELLVTSYNFRIDGLTAECHKFASRKISCINCITFLVLAWKEKQSDFLKLCTRFMQTNFERIVKESPLLFGDLPIDVLKFLIQDNNVNISKEEIVWDAILCWVQKAFTERMRFVTDLLLCLRADQIDEELASKIITHPLVKDNPRCNQIKECVLMNNDSVLDGLRSYIKLNLEINGMDIPGSRFPKSLKIFTKFCISLRDFSEGVEVYITFDEHIDIWTNISRKAFCPEVLFHISGKILMFDPWENVMFALDLLTNTWILIRHMNITRTEYSLVQVGNYIYALGGMNVGLAFESPSAAVERYNIINDQWEILNPMLPLIGGAAVVHNDKIYVIGILTDPAGDIMAAQCYDPISDSWNNISPPSYKAQFCAISYRGHIYVFGGHDNYTFTKSVEIYDTESNVWKPFEKLPYPYYLPKAVILNGFLFVYDNHSDERQFFRYPPSLWDEINQEWHVIEVSSPLNDFHVYQFCTVEDAGVIQALCAGNRNPHVNWKRSPFHKRYKGFRS